MPVVAYLGPERTNTHLAALKKFGAKARYAHAPTVEDVFREVERKKADFGVIPIENSLEGAVTHTLDRFMGERSRVRISGEVVLPIRHYFITPRGARSNGVNAIFSHPQALAQCRAWIQKRFPKARLVETGSTSEAVGLLGRTKKTARAGRETYLSEGENRAAIGRGDLARSLGLKAEPIPQDRDNRTRFLVLSLQKPKPGKRNKTSLMFALKDKPGALHDALMPFKENRINMTKIESRPSKRKAWEYVFFIDVEGHDSEPRVKRALQELARSTAELRVLGSYPAGSGS